MHILVCNHCVIVFIADVAVSANATDGSIRLTGGSGPDNGRVEIYYLERWGTVCNNNWGLLDATVVCRQLGYSNASSTYKFYGDRGLIWLDSIACTGYEANLTQCRGSELGVHHRSCSYKYKQAGVFCSGKLSIIDPDFFQAF